MLVWPTFLRFAQHMPIALLASLDKCSVCYIASANIVISSNAIQVYLYSNWNCLESQKEGAIYMKYTI